MKWIDDKKNRTDVKQESLPILEGFLFVAGKGFSRIAIGPDVARGVDQIKWYRLKKNCAEHQCAYKYKSEHLICSLLMF